MLVDTPGKWSVIFEKVYPIFDVGTDARSGHALHSAIILLSYTHDFCTLKTADKNKAFFVGLQPETPLIPNELRFTATDEALLAAIRERMYLGHYYVFSDKKE